MTDPLHHGVAVVAIAALVTVVLKFMSFLKHHVRESTEANTELTCVIREMLRYLERKNGSR